MDIKWVEKSDLSKTLKNKNHVLEITNQSQTKEKVIFSGIIEYGFCKSKYGTVLIGILYDRICAFNFCGEEGINESENILQFNKEMKPLHLNMIHMNIFK